MIKPIIFVICLVGVASSLPVTAFTSYLLSGCDANPDNYISTLYLYPAGGSCFVPAGSGPSIFNLNYGYTITYDQTAVYITQYDQQNCTGTDSMQTYTRDACDVALLISVYETLPPDSYWATAGLVGAQGPWQTILVTNYYSQFGCKGTNLTTIQVQGWPQCMSGDNYFCANGDINYDTCSDFQCTMDCTQAYKPLSSDCTSSADAPSDWEPYLNYNTSISYQASCVEYTPTPTPTPSISVSPNTPPSPSPSPSLTGPFVSFTTYFYLGCNSTAGNYVAELYLYPADGSCFSPAGGVQFSTSNAYRILYNQTTVTVYAYQSQNCTDKPSAVYYSMDDCSAEENVMVSVYPSLPSDEYWLDSNIEGAEPWQTVLVTSYYDVAGCNKSANSIQVQGWQTCKNGVYYFCNNGSIYSQLCSSSDCLSGCGYTSTLTDSCSVSADIPLDWRNWMDYTTSVSYQASCVMMDYSSSSVLTICWAIILVILAVIF